MVCARTRTTEHDVYSENNPAKPSLRELRSSIPSPILRGRRRRGGGWEREPEVLHRKRPSPIRSADRRHSDARHLARSALHAAFSSCVVAAGGHDVYVETRFRSRALRLSYCRSVAAQALGRCSRCIPVLRGVCPDTVDARAEPRIRQSGIHVAANSPSGTGCRVRPCCYSRLSAASHSSGVLTLKNESPDGSQRTMSLSGTAWTRTSG